MKHEWRKHEKELYNPKTEAQLLEIGKQKFFAIKGVGNPNAQDFSERIAVLYSLAYAIKMMPKSGFTPVGYFDYTVYPLEAVWEDINALNKEQFVYTMMIRQADFVNAELANLALEKTKKKKPHSFLDEVFFCELEEGLAVQILHIGDYDEEVASFAKMQAFMEQKNLKRRLDTHREIYLSDANKVERHKLKTILRYSVSK